ncbi:MAG TPA: hypothetical protein VFU17_13880 [Candidatus Limnocylindrales bacterium]|nr:hypothetical protein [Candidatus Limnocylindrales bacterium]
MFDFRFLNVGHGDCTIFDAEETRLTMVDVNNSKSIPTQDQVALAEAHGRNLISFSSERVLETGYRTWADYYTSLLVDPAEYFRIHFPNRAVHRYIQTHPDMDHMTGLHRFFLEEQFALLNFWDTQNTKEMSEADFVSSPYDYRDWLTYSLLRLGAIPSEREHHKVFNLLQGDTGRYWTDDQVEILAPTEDLLDYCNSRGDSWNNSSYVISVTYHGRRVVLAGDAEKPEWDKILATVPEDKLKCDVLKAAHHGRESGYSAEAMDAMRPSIVICSVGKKPETDASDEYAAHGARVLSTRYHGTIRVRLWMDGDVWVDDHAGNRLAALVPA